MKHSAAAPTQDNCSVRGAIPGHPAPERAGLDQRDDERDGHHDRDQRERDAEPVPQPPVGEHGPDEQRQDDDAAEHEPAAAALAGARRRLSRRDIGRARSRRVRGSRSGGRRSRGGDNRCRLLRRQGRCACRGRRLKRHRIRRQRLAGRLVHPLAEPIVGPLQVTLAVVIYDGPRLDLTQVLECEPPVVERDLLAHPGSAGTERRDDHLSPPHDPLALPLSATGGLELSLRNGWSTDRA